MNPNGPSAQIYFLGTELQIFIAHLVGPKHDWLVVETKHWLNQILDKGKLVYWVGELNSGRCQGNTIGIWIVSYKTRSNLGGNQGEHWTGREEQHSLNLRQISLRLPSPMAQCTRNSILKFIFDQPFAILNWIWVQSAARRVDESELRGNCNAPFRCLGSLPCIGSHSWHRRATKTVCLHMGAIWKVVGFSESILFRPYLLQCTAKISCLQQIALPKSQHVSGYDCLKSHKLVIRRIEKSSSEFWESPSKCSAAHQKMQHVAIWRVVFTKPRGWLLCSSHVQRWCWVL